MGNFLHKEEQTGAPHGKMPPNFTAGPSPDRRIPRYTELLSLQNGEGILGPAHNPVVILSPAPAVQPGATPTPSLCLQTPLFKAAV